MCSDAQIFIFLGFSPSELGSRATDDSVTVPRKEGGIEETFVGPSVATPPSGGKPTLHSGSENTEQKR